MEESSIVYLTVIVSVDKLSSDYELADRVGVKYPHS